jgi:hypothetical protein
MGVTQSKVMASETRQPGTSANVFLREHHPHFYCPCCPALLYWL